MSGLLFPPAGQGMLKRMVRLQRKKYREEEEMFLAEGVRTVRELLLHLPDPDSLVALFLTPDAEALLPEAEAYSGKVLSVDSVDFLRMTGTETPQGVAGVFRQPRFCPLEELPVGGEGRMVVALDGVQDPGNAGTILRTAAWFGADALLSGAGVQLISTIRRQSAPRPAVRSVFPITASIILRRSLKGCSGTGTK